MNTFQITILTHQGLQYETKSYTVSNDHETLGDLTGAYRAQGGIEVLQDGWKLWYPYHQITSIRLVGPAEPAPEQERQKRQRYHGEYGAAESKGSMEESIIERDNKLSKERERLNYVIRWAVNTTQGSSLLDRLDCPKLLDSRDIYAEFRKAVDKMLL